MLIDGLKSANWLKETLVASKDLISVSPSPNNISGSNASLTGNYYLTGATTKVALLKNFSGTDSASPGSVQTYAPQKVAATQFAPAAAPGQLNLQETKSVSDIAYNGKTGEVYQFPDGTFWRVDKTQDSGGIFSDGFKAVAMRRVVSDGKGGYKDDPTDNRVAIGFAGTNGINDVNDDIDQALGQTPEQYQDGLNFTAEVRAEASKNCETVTATGHSLGGGIASYVSIQTGIPATAINSAPLSNNKVPDDVNYDNQITQYYAHGEVLTDLDDFNPTDKRPGRHIEVSARYSEREYKWYNFIGVAIDNSKISVQNHSLDNTAPEIAAPQKVYG